MEAGHRHAARVRSDHRGRGEQTSEALAGSLSFRVAWDGEEETPPFDGLDA